jgi:hypothetical protein
MIWRVLAALLGFAVITTVIALLVRSDTGARPTLGWIVLGALTIVAAIVLAWLDSRWFQQPPEYLAIAWMTGVFRRIMIGEMAFLAGMVMFFTGLTSASALVAGLLASIALIWLFAAPTERKMLSIQEQLERAGGSGDLAALPLPQSQR